MRTTSLTFTPGQNIVINTLGEFFHLLETTSGLDIEFMQNGSVVSKAQNMEFGFFVKPKGGYTALSLTSALAQTIKLALGQGDGGYNRTTGSVQIIGQQGVLAQSNVQLTNANKAIIAARAAGKYTMVQNNDPVAVMRVTVDGVAASPTRGFRLQPGQPLDFSTFNPTGEINACMETATATLANCEFASG